MRWFVPILLGLGLAVSVAAFVTNPTHVCNTETSKTGGKHCGCPTKTCDLPCSTCCEPGSCSMGQSPSCALGK